MAAFLSASPEDILGVLAARSTFNVDTTQRDAWLAEVDVLKSALAGIEGTVCLEFDVPSTRERRCRWHRANRRCQPRRG